LREEFKRSWWTKLLALFALPVLVRFKRRTDPRRFNGATLLGLRGIVIKSHGGADETAFYWALRQATEEAQAGVAQRIAAKVQSRMAEYESGVATLTENI
jgi:glycerol-3-phosphate acyltransferase PlsX